MNISSMVVHTRPESLSNLQNELVKMPGIDVHGISDDGRVVITIEDTEEQSVAETVLAVQNLEGVLSATMVYNFNDDELNKKGGGE